MINFKFVKSQFKNVTIPLIVFFLILLILIIPSLTQNYFAPAVTIHRTSAGGSASSHIGAATILQFIFFGIPGFITLFSFSIILIHILISREVDRGYFASWLTTPMSRKTILNSKFFVLLSSVLAVYGLIFLFQLIVFPIRFKDFGIQAFTNILLYNFALILLTLFWTAINWFIICFLNKAAIAVSVASAVSIFFVVCATLVMVSDLGKISSLRFFKYLTITSFLNSPFHFGSLPSLSDPNVPPNFSGTISAKFLGLEALDFAWQLPVMLILPFIFFYLGNSSFIKKDFHV